jgi:hypothetical protein
MPKRWCIHGHDTEKVGRNTQGVCRACCVANQRRYTARKLARIQKFKIEQGCQRCGYNESAYALDFHHKDPNTKEFGIGRQLNMAEDRIWREIAKCDVLCRNCHAILHHDQEVF